MFRAKFRVLSVTSDWRGDTVISLKPVYPNSKTMEWAAAEDKCDENRAYWDATPSGEASIVYNGEAGLGARERFPVGRCVYFDFEPGQGEGEDDWRLGGARVYPSGLDLELYPRERQGQFKVGVQLRTTCTALLDAVLGHVRTAYAVPQDQPVPDQPWVVRMRPVAE